MSTSSPPITGPTGTSGTTLAPSTPGTTLVPTSSGMGQNSFLMLMMDQLKNQDPLSPGDPTQYLSELASFSTLQQETTIATSSTTAASGASASSALALLGHAISYIDSTGAIQTGTVQKVSFSGSGPSLTVNGATGISPSNVTEVS
jgi:flagellar basal-body rod modification protein FlgD